MEENQAEHDKQVKEIVAKTDEYLKIAGQEILAEQRRNSRVAAANLRAKDRRRGFVAGAIAGTLLGIFTRRDHIRYDE